MTHNVRPATHEDVLWLAPKLRKADVQEIEAASGQTPLAALSWSLLASSECWAGEGRDGELIALFGAAPTQEPDVGLVWLLGSESISTKNAVRFLRESRLWLDRLHQSYPILYNFVDARNTVHIHWLRWLGCTFIARHEHYGVGGLPFYEFVHVHKGDITECA